MTNNETPLRYYSAHDVDLVDHAWRVGARSRVEVQISLDEELEAYRARSLEVGGAVLSFV